MFTFQATIYIVGINPCVDVPKEITDQMDPKKGYIPVVGEIQSCDFKQTLIAVKDGDYRLFVNGVMLKRAKAKVGDTVQFTIKQDYEPREVLMPKQLEKKLLDQNLLDDYYNLIPSRQKDILNYLNYLKSEEALLRNIDRIIDLLKKKKNTVAEHKTNDKKQHNG